MRSTTTAAFIIFTPESPNGIKHTERFSIPPYCPTALRSLSCAAVPSNRSPNGWHQSLFPVPTPEMGHYVHNRVQPGENLSITAKRGISIMWGERKGAGDVGMRCSAPVGRESAASVG